MDVGGRVFHVSGNDSGKKPPPPPSYDSNLISVREDLQVGGKSASGKKYKKYK